jgi:hypothetical protein
MLEVRPVTCCAGFKAALFHFEPRKLGPQLLDPRVQVVDLRPVTTRRSGGQRLILDFGEINGNSHLTVIYLHIRHTASVTEPHKALTPATLVARAV